MTETAVHPLMRILIAIGIAAIAGPAFGAPGAAAIERGRALAIAGDCVSCHTAEHGTPFAGGRAIDTPFGTIYGPNLTPDLQTGIGAWTDDEFYRAVHDGIDPTGASLYPAFPFPYFTRMTREDVLAIRAYLTTLDPVSNRTPPPDFTWPLSHRSFARGWRWMFFKPGTFAPRADKSAQWNRGAYLVEGPGHCGACHTPKNALGADKADAALQGGPLQNWFAPTLTNGQPNGLAAWSADDIAEYLKTGRNRLSGATGLMAEVVTNSTAKMPPEDLKAIAVYLKDLPASAQPPSTKPDDATAKVGEAIFADTCSACHDSNGQGVALMFPPLAHNATVQSTDPTNVVRVILEGARTVTTAERPTPSSMPAFDWKLTDAEIAAVASFIRGAWGNSAPPVAAQDVAALRKALQITTR